MAARTQANGNLEKLTARAFQQKAARRNSLGPSLITRFPGIASPGATGTPVVCPAVKGEPRLPPSFDGGPRAPMAEMIS